MSLRKTKTVQFMDRQITVYELTMPQVDAFLQTVRAQADVFGRYLQELKNNPAATPPAGYQPHTLDILMGGKIPFPQVLQCLPELTEADLMAEGVSASDLAPIYQAVEDVNPFFIKAGENVAEQAGLLESRVGSMGTRRTSGNPV